MKKLILLVVWISGSIGLHAQSIEDNQKPEYKWSIETELVQPFIPTVEIWTIQGTRKLFDTGKQQGHLLIGAYLRPNVEHDVVEEIDEYMLYTAYRHFFWKGLHLEAGMNTGYYWGRKNLVDGKDYEGIALFWESNIGYKFNIGKTKRFFLNPQFGFIGTMGIADIGPRQGKTDNFIQGNLLIGLNF
jgi:hypothetical protein